MDLGQFLSALLAIIVIDIVLAGDNAIVIALAARSLPAHLQKRAIVWGAIGAIGVRSLMTVIVGECPTPRPKPSPPSARSA